MWQRRFHFLGALDLEEILLLAFLTLLPFHLVLKRLLPGPLGTYWKEGLLALLLLAWAWRCLRAGRLLLPKSSLNWPVFLLLGLLFLHLLVDGNWRVSAWGFYMSAMYLPLYWITAAILERRSRFLHRYIWIVIAVGTLVSLGGIAEFLFNVTLWPSADILQRQGFYEVYIYATHIRRVYFTFDSPTTLANYLALLLPLALTLFPTVRSWWGKALLGLAAALMAACTVLTFSRGIWVAALLALLAAGVLSGAAWRNRRYVAYAGGTLLVGALVWGGVAVGMGHGAVNSSLSVVELSPAQVSRAPIQTVAAAFLQESPAEGEVMTQTWGLAGPDGAADTRTVLYEHPLAQGQARIIYRVNVPPEGALRFAIALAPEVWSPDKGDGVSFQLYVQGSDQGRFVFVRYINPKANIADRKWRQYLVDMSAYAGQTVSISFITESGPQGDYGFDWAGWAEPQLVTVPAAFFATATKENAVLAYTGSIVNWTTEETNQDRVQAWLRSWRMFQSRPWWGVGIGRTGEASLRTMPESGFVTESQLLKAAVELGLPGLLLLLFLWLSTLIVGYQGYRQEKGLAEKALRLGILAGLLAILINGVVYQNMEVKQVNAYFWFFLGIVAFAQGQLKAHSDEEQNVANGP